MTLTEIGRCKGCDRSTVLDDGVCRKCLDTPSQGRRWAEFSHRCRTNPEFAATVYGKLTTNPGRDLFIRAYGLPPGCVAPGLSLLK